MEGADELSRVSAEMPRRTSDPGNGLDSISQWARLPP
jgi:hypothetical protein